MISSITAAGCTDHFLFFVFSLSAPRVKKMNEQKIKEKNTNNIASFMGHELCDLDRLGADLG